MIPIPIGYYDGLQMNRVYIILLYRNSRYCNVLFFERYKNLVSKYSKIVSKTASKYQQSDLLHLSFTKYIFFFRYDPPLRILKNILLN